MFFAPLSGEAIKMYREKDERGLYRDKDFVFKNKSTNANQKYEIICPDGERVRPKDGYIYRFVRERFEQAKEEGLVTFKRTKTGPLVDQNGDQAHWNIYIKKYLGDAMGAPSTLIPKELNSAAEGLTKTQTPPKNDPQTPSTPSQGGSVQTGDTAHVALWLVLAGMSVIAYVAVRRKRA